MMRHLKIIAVMCCLAASALAAPIEVLRFNYSDYDNLLRSYVSADGLVDYEGLRATSLEELQKFLDQISNVKLKGATDQEQIAFWINAYNAHVLQQVLVHRQTKRLDEIANFYDTPLTIAQGSYSLKDIREKVLRQKTTDPRIHFVLANGALGSPRLRNYAILPSTLEARLREASTEFANSPKYVRLQGDQLYICRVMQWYADDFKVFGGAANYLNRLIDAGLRKDATAVKQHLITAYDKAIFEFDWTVNDLRLNTNIKRSRP